MTRVCSVCRKVLGEKRPACGGEAQPLNVNAAGHPIVGTEFLCPQCNRRFGQGEGGETSGLCKACLQIERGKAVGR
jgi:hypothetical protein